MVRHQREADPRPGRAARNQAVAYRCRTVNWPIATKLVVKTVIAGAGLWAVSTPNAMRNLGHGVAAYLILTIWCFFDRTFDPIGWGRCLLVASLLYFASVQLAHLLLLWGGRPASF